MCHVRRQRRRATCGKHLIWVSESAATIRQKSDCNMTVTYLCGGSIAGLLRQFQPDGPVAPWLFHTALVAVAAGVLDPRLQRLGGENHVDAQATLRFDF